MLLIQVSLAVPSRFSNRRLQTDFSSSSNFSGSNATAFVHANLLSHMPYGSQIHLPDSSPLTSYSQTFLPNEPYPSAFLSSERAATFRPISEPSLSTIALATELGRNAGLMFRANDGSFDEWSMNQMRQMRPPSK